MVDYNRPLALKNNRDPEIDIRVRCDNKSALGNYMVSWEAAVGRNSGYFDSEGKSLECVEWYLINTPDSKNYYVTCSPLGPYASKEAAILAASKIKGTLITFEERNE